ncbi:MAG TPA: hypothetical protein PLV68_21195 [Ilumatobacteraceae bacterium]|nr:hypothetical protein [Ilumatobacteraceae bacterium]
MSEELMGWVVTVVATGPAGVDVDGAVEALLADGHDSVSSDASGGVVSVIVADSNPTALKAATWVADGVLATLGDGWTLTGVQVQTEAAFDAELERPAIPPLVGLAEAAGILGVSRQRVGQLVDRLLPVARLASGPVFLESAVLAFKAEPRRVGRPTSVAS